MKEPAMRYRPVSVVLFALLPLCVVSLYAAVPLPPTLEKLPSSMQEILDASPPDARHDVIVILQRQEKTLPELIDVPFASHLTRFTEEGERTIARVSGPLGAKVLQRFPTIASFAANLSAGEIESLARNPLVETIYPEKIGKLYRAEGNAIIRAPALHTQNGRGAGVTVAVIDDGVDYRHPELGGSNFPNSVVIGGYDFIWSEANGTPTENPLPACDGSGECDSHGTSVAGIIAGRGDTQTGATGVAPQARIVGLVVAGAEGIPERHIIGALDWVNQKRAQHGIRVVNMSLGFSAFSASTCDSAPGVEGIRMAIERLVSANVAVVVASGNEAKTNGIAFPACLSQAISVGAVYDANIGSGIQFQDCTDATTAADKVTCYSNSAGFLTLLAPSHNARSPRMTMAGGGYDNTFGGTSAAAPYTAGAIAALMSVDPKSNRPPAEYVQILRETGKPVLDGKSGFTTPRIDLDAAYKMLTGQTQTATLSLGSASGTCGASVDVPVSISSVTGLTALDFRVTFDASRLSVTQAILGSLTTSWSGQFDASTSGSVRLTLSGPAVSGSGTVAVIRFAIASTAPSGATNLGFSNVLINGAARSGTGSSLQISCSTGGGPRNNVYFVPAAARLTGSNNTFFKSDFRVFNLGSSTATADFHLQATPDGTVASSRTLTIAAGRSIAVDDAIFSLYSMATGGGAIRVASDQPLQVTSNLYTTNNICPERGGGFGQYIPGLRASDGSTRQRLYHLINNTAQRSNVGFVNTTASSATVTVTLKRENGQTIGTANYTLGPYGWTQVNRVFEVLGAGTSGNAFAEITSSRAVISYVSVVDNFTGDAIFIWGIPY
jgi:subtilisin family serine protease